MIRFQLAQVIWSHAGFMPETVKQCHPFQLPKGRVKVIMEGSRVLNMRQLRFSLFHSLSIPNGRFRFKVSISTTTPMKRSGLLLTKLPAHRILYVMYVQQTVRHLCSRFAFVSSTLPVA